MWGVLKNVTALAAESAQNLTSQATQLLEKLDGEMNQDNQEENDNEEGVDSLDNANESEVDTNEKPEVQQVIGVDGETLFVTKTPKKKSKPKTEPVVETALGDTKVESSNNEKADKKEFAVEQPPVVPATTRRAKKVSQGEDSPSVSGLLQEEVVGLKSLITELTNKMDSMQTKHASELEAKQKEVQVSKKELGVVHEQLTDAKKKVELLEKQTNILQLQSNLKEIKDSRDAMKNEVANTLNAFQSEFSSMIGALTPQKNAAPGSAENVSMEPSAEFQKQLKALQSENEHLKEQLSVLNTKLAASHEVHQQLTVVVEGLKTAKEQYQEKTKKVMSSMKEKHNEEVKQMKTAQETLKAELAALRTDQQAVVAKLQGERQAALDQLSGQQEQEASLQDTVRELREKLASLQEEMTAQTEEHESEWKSQIDSLQREVESAKKEAQKADEALQSVTQEKDDLLARVAAAGADIDAAVSAVRTAHQEEVAALTTEIADLNGKLDSVQSLKEAFDSITQDSQKTVETMAHQNEVIAQLTSDNESLAGTVKELQEKVKELNQEKLQKASGADASAESEQLQKELAVLAGAHTELETELVSVRKQLSDSEQVIEQLTIELKKTLTLKEETLQLLHDQMAEESAAKGVMSAGFLETKNALKATQTQLEAEVAEHSKLRTLYEQLLKVRESESEGEMTWLRTANVELSDANKSLEQRVSALQNELNEAQQQLSSAATDNSASAEQLSALSALKSDLEAELATVKDAHDELTEQKEQLSGELASLQKQLTAANEEVQRLSDELSQVKETSAESAADSKALDEKLTELSTMNTSLQQQLIAANDEVQRLTDELSLAQQLTSDAGSVKEALEEKLTDLNAVNTSLQQQLIAANEELQRVSSDLQASRESSNSGVQELENKVAELTEQSASLSRTLESQNASVHELMATVDEQKRLFGDKESEFEGVLKSLTEAQQQVAELTAQKASLLQSIQESEQLNSNLQESLSVIETQKADLQEARQKLSASEQMVLELTALKESLVLQIEATNEKNKELSNSLSEATMKVMKFQGESLIVKDEYQSRINVLETSLQDRVVENATLNEKLRDLTAKGKRESEELMVTKAALSAAQEQLASLTSESGEAVRRVQSLLDAALEELRETQQRCDQLSEQQTLQSAEIIQLTARLSKLKNIEETCSRQTQQIAELESRAENAEESVSRVNEKKKKDLDNLKKQNEKIAALQREKASLEDQLSELRESMEHHASAGAAHESKRVVDLEKEVAEWRGRCEQLESQVVELRAAAEEATAHSKTASTVDDQSVLIQDLQHQLHEAEQKLLESIQVNATWEKQHAALTAEMAIVNQKLLSITEELESSQKALHHANSDHTAEIVRLNNELLTSQSTASNQQARINQLEGEIKALQKSISHTNMEIVAPVGQRQRIDRTSDSSLNVLDLETGIFGAGEAVSAGVGIGGVSSTAPVNAAGSADLSSLCIEIPAESDRLSEKKESVGSHPLMYMLWNQFRKYTPWLIPVVGERPPRVTTLGLVVITYFCLLQLIVLYLGWFRVCK